jgi:hypothetical protein
MIPRVEAVSLIPSLSPSPNKFNQANTQLQNR